jgi:cysteinyl-tRNA synthetase
MKLYNTLTLNTEEFVPQQPGQVNMYVCGPTVYNYAHIGNARPIVVFDTLRRVFEQQGYKVKYVSNFTDVDDKIINKAIEEKVDEMTIANRYIDAYNKVRSSLHVIPLDATPRVTQTMDEIIAFIDQLVKTGHAYEENGDVYFDIASDPDYGELSHQRIDDLQSGARVEENEQKHNPLDFALWKKTTKGIQWDSPWGKGRPGWHTECVVMIGKEFGTPTIDIHGGGKDLIFPHHENEMAQAMSVNGKPLAKWWLHNGMLSLMQKDASSGKEEEVKMSKSLGNIIWAQDFIDKFGANLTRWILLSVHYRDMLGYSADTVLTAQTELERIYTALRQAEVKAQLAGIKTDETVDKKSFDAFMEAMDDDLNTPNAYKVIFETVKQLNTALRQREIDWTLVIGLHNAIVKMLDVLGLTVEKTVVSNEDRQVYDQWQLAKQEKDFEAADKYRAILQQHKLI